MSNDINRVTERITDALEKVARRAEDEIKAFEAETNETHSLLDGVANFRGEFKGANAKLRMLLGGKTNSPPPEFDAVASAVPDPLGEKGGK
jgi:REP element-mobilizing transposase RayT